MLHQTNVPGLSAQGTCSHPVNLYFFPQGGSLQQQWGNVPLGPVLMTMSLSSWWVARKQQLWMRRGWAGPGRAGSGTAIVQLRKYSVCAEPH